MATLYSDEIEGAAQDIRDAGAPVTFARGSAGYDAATDSWSGSPVTASSNAIRVKGNPTRFLALGLTIEKSVSLLVESQSLGSFAPVPSDQMSFAGEAFAVKDVEPVAPDGTAIMYRIVGSR